MHQSSRLRLLRALCCARSRSAMGHPSSETFPGPGLPTRTSARRESRLKLERGRANWEVKKEIYLEEHKSSVARAEALEEELQEARNA